MEETCTVRSLHACEKTSAPEYRRWGKTPRFEPLSVSITEKIDGTNACFIVLPDENDPTTNNIYFGSRKRLITVEDDNYGFAAWASVRMADMADALGPGYHFGEFWGKKIQRGYDMFERHFSLFDVPSGREIDWDGLNSIGVHHVPTLYEGLYTQDVAFDAMEKLRAEGSKAAPGYMNPEGIVIKYGLPGSPREKLTFHGPKWQLADIAKRLELHASSAA